MAGAYSVVQEDSMGCGVACVAYLLNVSYGQALRLFGHTSGSVRGYYCPEICKALAKGGLSYGWQKISPKNSGLLKKDMAIIFVAANKRYPAGHYLVRTPKGYMNPWMNFPAMNPAKAGIASRLPGKPTYVCFPRK